MYKSKAISDSKSLQFDLTEHTLKKEFDTILDFVTDICEISDAFISIKTDQKHIIISKRGLDSFNSPDEIVHFNELINRSEALILPNANQDCNYQLSGSKEAFLFFAGFPINTSNNSVSANLCILSKKSNRFTANELKILNQCVSQIKSILNLSLKNYDLKTQLSETKMKFQSFIENSNEIIYELTLEGTISSVSKNFTLSIGYEAHEVIGKSNATLIHPEDIEKCSDFLQNTKLNENNDKELLYRVLHKNGRYIWHSSKIILIEKNNKQFYLGNCRDITEYVESQQELKLQKEFYETILDRLPTDVAVFNSNYKYIYVNPIAIKNKELREYIIGKDDFEYTKHTNRADTFAIERRAKFNIAVQTKETISWEEELYNAVGEQSFHNRKFTPVFNKNGTLEIMIGFSVDITETKKRQNEILNSRQLVTRIIENVAVGILVQGPKSEIIENNKAACEMLGLTQDQLLGKTSFDEHWEVIHEDGSTFTAEEHPVPLAIKELKAINNIVMGVRRPIKNDLVWLLVDAIPVFGDTNQLLYVICSFNDITRQKNIEAELKVRNERFTYVNMATSDVIWDWEIGSENFIMSENYTKLFGHKLNNENHLLKVRDFENLIHPDDLERTQQNLKIILESKENTWYDEFRYLKSDGTYAFLKDKAYIVRDESDKAIRMIGAQTDITLKQKLKEDLVRSKEKFKAAFEHSSLGIAFVNLDGYYTTVNTIFCKTLGYSEEELKKLNYTNISHPDDLLKQVLDVKKLISNEKNYFQIQKRYIHKKNTVVWTNLFVSAVRDINNKILYFIAKIIDITEIKKIEEQNKILLEENNRNSKIRINTAENLYRLLADNTIDLVCLHDLNMAFQYVSPSIEALAGYNPEDMIGKTPMDYAHPEDVERMTAHLFSSTAANLATPMEYRYITSNGDCIWLETIAKIVFENDIPVKVQTSTRDISLRKKAESVIEKTLKQERELNELRNNLVSTISHEFRTPMTTIRTSAELIEIYIENENSKNEQHLKKQINRITGEIDRIIELMNAVLIISKDHSGKTTFKPINFNLKELCINIIETSFNNNIKDQKVDFNFEGNQFVIFADKNLIEYSLFNLLHNAFKYSDNCKNIVMRLTSNTSTLQIEIIDFGIGIPEEDQPKLFNTFFRASNTSGIQGTGLGLYIVKTFLERNSGTIELESQLGKGTKVTIQLPKI